MAEPARAPTGPPEPLVAPPPMTAAGALATGPPAGTPPGGTPSAPAGRVTGWVAWPLRGLALLTATLILLQAVTAGLFVTGAVELLDLHAAGHVALLLVVFLQFVAAILVWRPGYGPAWPI